MISNKHFGIILVGLFFILAFSILSYALADGDIIVADPTSDRIISVTPTGDQSQIVYGNLLFSVGSFQVADVAVSPAGEIFFVDSHAFGGPGGIFKIVAPNQAPLQYFSHPDFVDPNGIAIDKDGNIIVADMSAFGGNGAIFKVVNSSPPTLEVIARGDTLGAVLVDPTRVAIDANGNYIVVDISAGGISTPFGPSGAIIKVTPSGTQSKLFEGDFDAD